VAYGWADVCDGDGDPVPVGPGEAADGDGDGPGPVDSGDGDGLDADGVGEWVSRRCVRAGLGVGVAWCVGVGLETGAADPVSAGDGGRTCM
jgi:hypothetical protein